MGESRRIERVDQGHAVYVGEPGVYLRRLRDPKPQMLQEDQYGNFPVRRMGIIPRLFRLVDLSGSGGSPYHVILYKVTLGNHKGSAQGPCRLVIGSAQG